MRQRYCRVCGDWHDLDEYWPRNCLPERPQVSDLPRPMLIRDGIDDVWNPTDGKRYTSKSAYYKAVKASGNVIVGDDPAVKEHHHRIKDRKIKTPGGLKDDLKQAWEQVVK
jgi:hypothetical protein